MKNLFLVRHAKSSWNNSHQADIERMLNERGLQAAPMMAKRFAKMFTSPQVWLSSPAVRAMETAKFFAKEFTRPFDKIQIAPDLYSFELFKVLKLIESSDDQVDSAIYFFHNPTITEVIQHYTGESVSVPTCAIALVEFDVNSWKHLSANAGVLKHFDYPKNELR